MTFGRLIRTFFTKKLTAHSTYVVRVVVLKIYKETDYKREQPPACGSEEGQENYGHIMVCAQTDTKYHTPETLDNNMEVAVLLTAASRWDMEIRPF